MATSVSARLIGNKIKAGISWAKERVFKAEQIKSYFGIEMDNLAPKIAYFEVVHTFVLTPNDPNMVVE